MNISANDHIERHTKEGVPIFDLGAALPGMRKAGQLAAEILDFITPYVEPGVETGELDRLCHEKIEEAGAVAACIGYKGYTKATCISVNHVVCHGIPGDKKLKNGDILNIDVTVIVDGWYGDTSRMYLCGKVPKKAELLVDATYESMMRGIEIIAPGVTLGDVGHAIQTYAEDRRFSVVRDFCGHGIGRSFHTPPSVLHFGTQGTQTVLEEGMIFTVEPMINAGTWETHVLDDGWTAITRDRSLSAQFEHTLAVTADGYEIFTLSPKGFSKPPYE